MGRPNAAVLPVPVWAWPITSCPSRELGNRLLLDRRGLVEAQLVNCCLYLLGKPESLKLFSRAAFSKSWHES